MNLFIFRRDLRLIDNTTLISQIKTLDCKIVPAFIFTPEQIDPKQNKYFNSNSVQFMIQSLKDLTSQISQYKGKIYYFYGDNLQVLKTINEKTKINSIGFNLDYTPYAKRRDQEIKVWAKSRNIQIFSQQDYALYQLIKIEFMGKNNTPPTFTPFKQFCYQNLKVREPTYFDKFSFQVYEQIQNLPVSFDFPKKSRQLYIQNSFLAVDGGRQQALNIINNFKNYKNYFEDRNYPALPATKLSAYLHFTNVSIRQVYYNALKQFGKDNHLIFQLHCRQFFTYITHKFPKVMEQNLKNLKEQFNQVKWNMNQNYLQKWKQGKTGVPFVDSGIRQMNITGYMHNRTRQNVACFLVKDLFINWQEGQKYFAQKLVDYSATQNSGNWQYVAGVGTDPRQIRIFNPWLQAQKYDPQCQYIKKWIPQLENVPVHDILNWQKTCQNYIKKGVNYPEPIVNHDNESKKVQIIYQNILNPKKKIVQVQKNKQDESDQYKNKTKINQNGKKKLDTKKKNSKRKSEQVKYIAQVFKIKIVF